MLTVVHCAVQVEEEQGAFWDHDYCPVRSRRYSLASDVSLIENKPRLTWQASLRELVSRTTRSKCVVHRILWLLGHVGLRRGEGQRGTEVWR